MDFLYVGMGNALNARIGQFFNQAFTKLLPRMLEGHNTDCHCSCDSENLNPRVD